MPSEISRLEPTTPTYEEWEVVIGKNKFLLKGQQVVALKREISTGKRGLLWFKDFAISIPHIECAYKIPSRPTTVESQLPEYTRLTDEEREQSVKKLAEMRKQFSTKLP